MTPNNNEIQFYSDSNSDIKLTETTFAHFGGLDRIKYFNEPLFLIYR